MRVRFTYTNWRGETRERVVLPDYIWFGTSPYHEGQQWFLKAVDCEKGLRDFAMKDIRDWRPAGEE